MSVDHVNRHADLHGIALAGEPLSTSVDHGKFFTCPTLAPLFHTAIFSTLSEPQQRRYNQFVALMQNELICFFEQELADRVLPVLLKGDRGLDPQLAASLRRFLHDERQHTQMFRRLNQLAEPAWYAAGDYHILRLTPAMLAPLRWIASRPEWFPMVFWIMLLMEERSLMISRRYAAMDPATLDSRFAETYRAHAEDEVRHVHLDWHMLEHFYISRPRWLRRVNAKLLEWFMVGLFFKPKRANVRLVELLIAEYPELASRRAELRSAVAGLVTNPGYRTIMYSAESTPISRELFERMPEFASLRKRLYAEVAE